MSGARFSRDRTWRYRLWRQWGDGPTIAWIGLNPSTADAAHNDPTIRRCIGFSRDWGYGGLQVVNLFAFCATKPPDLWRQPPKVRAGPGWAAAFWAAIRRSDRVVCCWGSFHRAPAADRRQAEARAATVVQRLRKRGVPLVHLGLTRTGQPRHPLYRPASQKAIPWTSGEQEG
ncbi:MAG: DUF1643 domain-containing protein [Myxococcota bacterium]